MENEKKQTQDTAKANSHKDMPVKNTATDLKDNTAGQPGYNQSKTVKNDLEPGTHERNRDSSETDWLWQIKE